MQISIVKDGKQLGPFSEDQVRSMLMGDLVGPTDLGSCDGLENWLPLSQLINIAQSSSTPSAVPSTSRPVTTLDQNKNSHPGFWLRFGAAFIDYLIYCVSSSVLGYMLAAGFYRLLGFGYVLHIFAFLITLSTAWLYFALMESSPKQGTLGKMAFGIVVSDLHGARLSFRTATVRFFSKSVSALIVGISFLMCAWTERKQCLHDQIAGCLLYKRN